METFYDFEDDDDDVVFSDEDVVSFLESSPKGTAFSDDFLDFGDETNESTPQDALNPQDNAADEAFPPAQASSLSSFEPRNPESNAAEPTAPSNDVNTAISMQDPAVETSAPTRARSSVYFDTIQRPEAPENDHQERLDGPEAAAAGRSLSELERIAQSASSPRLKMADDQVETLFQRLHEECQGNWTASRLLARLKALHLYPYVVSQSQFDQTLGHLDGVLTLSSLEDALHAWSSKNEPLRTFLPNLPDRRNLLLSCLVDDQQCNPELVGLCKAAVLGSMWSQAVLKQQKPKRPKPPTSLGHSAMDFVARMQSDVHKRKLHAAKRLEEYQKAIEAMEMPPLSPRFGLSKGSKRILKQSGMNYMTSKAWLERLVHVKDNAVDTAATISMEPQRKKSKKKARRRIHHDLFALAEHQAKKIARKQLAMEEEARERRQTVRLTKSSKAKVRARLDKEIRGVLAYVAPNDDNLRPEQVQQVLDACGLLSTTNDDKVMDLVALLPSETSALRQWIHSVVFNAQSASWSSAVRTCWQHCRRNYLARRRPQLYHVPLELSISPTKAKKTTSSSLSYTLDGKLVDSTDRLGERHLRTQQWVQRLRMEQEDAAIAPCTFVPQVLDYKGGNELMEQRHEQFGDENVGHRLYSLAQERLARHQERMKRAATDQATAEMEIQLGAGSRAADTSDARLAAFYVHTAKKAHVRAFDKAVAAMQKAQAEETRKRQVRQASVALHLNPAKLRSSDGRTTVPRPFEFHKKPKCRVRLGFRVPLPSPVMCKAARKEELPRRVTSAIVEDVASTTAEIPRLQVDNQVEEDAAEMPSFFGELLDFSHV
ncbi:hypothetical protein Ae201684P_004239 [Aphanomyces euteiches]|nr:hypothetical protein Ae201684P_004239 [Aphanomyces euteiches]